MKNRFIRGSSTAFENINKAEYNNSIVFLEDTKQIWSNGSYYGGVSIINTSYNNLKTLRNNSQLVPGQQYRIIDYVASTIQENTQAISYNRFDIIVTADATNVLNERAKASPSDGSVYYDNNNLSAWEVWYCIDNDINRFLWADENNGKGVVYRLIDEFGNDIPFDFKGIKTCSKVSSFYHYLFSNNFEYEESDYSLTGNVMGNKINPYFNDNNQQLINNIFITQKSDNCKIKNNYIGYNVDNFHIIELNGTYISDNYIGNNNLNIYMEGVNITNYNIAPNTNNMNIYELLEINNNSHLKLNIAKKSNNNIVVYNEADLIAG